MPAKDISASGKKVAEAVSAWSKAHEEMAKLKISIDKLHGILASNGSSPADLAKKVEAGVKLGKLTAKLGPMEKKLSDANKAMGTAQKELAKAAK